MLAWTALLFVSNFLWYLILVTLSRWGGQWEEKHTCSWLEWSNWRRKYWEYAFSWNGFEGACFLEGLCYSLLVFQPYASILCLFLSFNMMHNKHCFSFSPLPSLLTVICFWFCKVFWCSDIICIVSLSRLRLLLCLHWPNSGEQTLLDCPSQVWVGLLTCCWCWLKLLDFIPYHSVVYAIVSCWHAFSVSFRCQITWWSEVYGSIRWVVFGLLLAFTL